MSIESRTHIAIDDFVAKNGTESPWSLHIYGLAGKAIISLVWNGHDLDPANQTVVDLAEFKRKVAEL